MLYTTIAIMIFIATLTLIIWQPKGLNIGWSAAGGAILAFIAGIVSLDDVVEVIQITWNATFTFIAIVLITLIMDQIGFFEWAALHMARIAQDSGIKLFIYVSLLGAIVTALFNNDGAALILTPIVLAMVRNLNLQERMILPFVMASGFIADTTSLPLVISNLVNIITADFFGIGFLEYALRMWVPNLFSLAATIGLMLIYYRRSIPERYDAGMLKPPAAAIKDHNMFRLSWGVLAILLVGYFKSEFIRLPVSIIAGLVALLFLWISRKSDAVDTKAVIRGAPWNIVIFAIGMYLVVYGLGNVGLTGLLADAIQTLANYGLFVATVAMGLIAAILSSTMNNLPAVMIDALAISQTETSGTIR